MAKSTFNPQFFEKIRGGARHRYEVRDETLAYSAPSTTSVSPVKQLEIPWRDIVRLRPGQGESLYFVRSSGQELGIWLDPKDMQVFLSLAIAAWGKHNQAAARKAIFDYGTSEPAIGWIWLILSLVFPGMLALMLLSDGYHELNCNRFLENGLTAAAKIVKIKKNRRGNFVWTLEFTTPNGEKLVGKREVPFATEKGEPLGSASKDNVTIIYSPERPACWDVSMKQNEAALNRTQRHFVVLLDLSFGWIFAFISVIGTGFSIARIRRQHPYREVVRLAGEKI